MRTAPPAAPRGRRSAHVCVWRLCLYRRSGPTLRAGLTLRHACALGAHHNSVGSARPAMARSRCRRARRTCRRRAAAGGGREDDLCATLALAELVLKMSSPTCPHRVLTARASELWISQNYTQKEHLLLIRQAPSWHQKEGDVPTVAFKIYHMKGVVTPIQHAPSRGAEVLSGPRGPIWHATLPTAR